ncbi:MAG: hypothetical protein J5967_05845 [Oscillospiraceae bacterium]|nr:hypothetical protein [Oscillospiraceae bacterium]
MALGIAIFKFAVLGNDPYTGMNMALAELFSIPFPTLQLGVNLLFFLLQFLLARELIGFGTLFNALFIGSMVDFFYRVMVGALGLPTSFPVQLLVMLIGMLICSFGLSLYQCSDLGVSPYDAASLILDKKLARIPYFWCRIFTDGICALICYLAGGIIGVGTLVTAFGFGPVIAIFNRVVSPIIQNTPAET